MHQLTPNAIVKLSVFIWAVHSQGAHVDVEAFGWLHELHYGTKARPSNNLHNNLECYNFSYQKDMMTPMLVYQTKWPIDWTKELFYVKADMKNRDKFKCIIMSPWRWASISRDRFATWSWGERPTWLIMPSTPWWTRFAPGTWCKNSLLTSCSPHNLPGECWILRSGTRSLRVVCKSVCDILLKNNLYSSTQVLTGWNILKQLAMKFLVIIRKKKIE